MTAWQRTFSKDLSIHCGIYRLVPGNIWRKARDHLIHVQLSCGWDAEILPACLPAGPTKEDSETPICSKEQGNEDITKEVCVLVGSWQRWQRPQGPFLLALPAQTHRRFMPP